jgi:phage terminase Nu1 subunit (DNA packaging protein)
MLWSRFKARSKRQEENVHSKWGRKMDSKSLQSWKEIARYLDRGIRTVQRWEKFGLPVHRPAGHDRSAVFALKHELDAWLYRAGNSHRNGSFSTVEQELAYLRSECARLQARLDELEGEANIGNIDGALRPTG